MNKNHTPLQMHADFVGSPSEFAKPEATMLMRVAKRRSHFGERAGSFFSKVRRQLVRCFPDSFREQDFDHSAPEKGTSPPDLCEEANSASAASSATVAWASVTPYSSKVGKSLGLNGRPRSLTICAKNMETAAVGVIPISRQTSSASAASCRSIRSLICSVMYQLCLMLGLSQELGEERLPGDAERLKAGGSSWQLAVFSKQSSVGSRQ